MAAYRALLISPYPELMDVVARVAPDFAELDVTVHQGDLSEGLAAAIGSFDSAYDVIISRGGTAQMLADELNVPVIEIKVSAADLMEALARWNPEGERTAVVGFSNTLDAVHQIADFSDFDLDIYDVAFEDELPLVLEDVRAGDYRVVFCDTFSLDACTAMRLDAHLLASGEKSVSDALERATYFCQQTHELQTKAHVLWELVRVQPAKIALFSAEGRLFFSNLEEQRTDLLMLMRDHLSGPSTERLTLRRGRRTFRVDKSVVEHEDERYVAFSVMAASAPTSDSLTGIERLNREEVDRSYHDSVFHTVDAGTALTQQIVQAVRSGRPIALEGEVGSGKAQIAPLIYLTGGWGARPFVVIDCPLLTPKSWEYLMDSPHSPLYGSDETIWLKAVHALGFDQIKRLLGVLRQTGVCSRNHVIFSANDITGTSEASALSVIEEYLRCHVLTAPPLRRRPDIRRAVSLFLGAEALRVGTDVPFVTDEAMDLLVRHSWPKNYLELRQVLQRSMATAEGGAIQAKDVLEALDREGTTRFSSLDTPNESSSIDLLRPLRETEREIVQLVLNRFGGNQTEAAHVLGVSRTTIWRLLKE